MWYLLQDAVEYQLLQTDVSEKNKLLELYEEKMQKLQQEKVEVSTYIAHTYIYVFGQNHEFIHVHILGYREL